MEKYIILIVFVAISSILFAQSPEKFSYQAVIRDGDGFLITESTIGMKVSILQDVTPVYVETHTPSTDQNGMIYVEIGTGSSADDFSAIDWANGIFFLKIETDILGGTNYTLTSTTQILSVPYALHAKSAETLTGTISENDPVFNVSAAAGISSGDVDNWDEAYSWGNHADAGYLQSFTEAQILTISNDTIYLTGGSYVKLPAGFSGSWDDLSDVPTNLTTIINNNFDGDYSDLTNVPTNVSVFTNDAGYITDFIEQDTTLWKIQGNNIYYSDGFVSLGCTNPTYRLEVAGGIRAKFALGQIVEFSTPGSYPGVVFKDTIINIRSDVKMNNSGAILFSTGSYSDGSAGQTSRMIIENTGYVGIGTSTPQAKLDVQGNVKIVDGTQGDGKVLTSDANGNASWQTPTGSIGGTSQNWQIFTSSGTFTVPAGVEKVMVEIIGAGGGGARYSSNVSDGGAGGPGCYGKSIINVTPGEIIPITIGAGGIRYTGSSSGGGNGDAGGNTTFGSYITATGGGGGQIVGGGTPGTCNTPIFISGSSCGNSGSSCPPKFYYNSYGFGGRGAGVSNGTPSNGTSGVVIIYW